MYIPGAMQLKTFINFQNIFFAPELMSPLGMNFPLVSLPLAAANLLFVSMDLPTWDIVYK